MNLSRRSQLNQDALTGSLSPSGVLDLALGRLNASNSISMTSDVDNTRYQWQTYPAYDITVDAPDVLANNLLLTAKAIYGTVSTIQTCHSSSDQAIDLLALYISRYRRCPGFLYHAASLLEVTEGGELLYPELPALPSWEWVPSLNYLQRQD